MLIFNEGGINWAWFTELEVSEDKKSVTILAHYRLHKYNDDWPEKNRKAPLHPEFYATQKWRETNDRTVTHYNVPGIGWLPISNSKYIFSY